MTLAIIPENGCEGCSHCLFPGIRWPASPDGFSDRSWVERCDTCELYGGDEEAAKAVAGHFGVRWGWAERAVEDGEIRWEPPEGDGPDYSGWSVFIDHPARDDESAYVFGGAPATLHLGAGDVAALHYAITEVLIKMAPEWSDGETWAIVTRNTLETIRDNLPAPRRAPENALYVHPQED